jgi:hypothetical protein
MIQNRQMALYATATMQNSLLLCDKACPQKSLFGIRVLLSPSKAKNFCAPASQMVQQSQDFGFYPVQWILPNLRRVQMSDANTIRQVLFEMQILHNLGTAASSVDERTEGAPVAGHLLCRSLQLFPFNFTVSMLALIYMTTDDVWKPL